MKIEEVLIDLEEACICVEFVRTFVSLIYGERRTYIVFKGGFHLEVKEATRGMLFSVGCHDVAGNVKEVIFWPSDENDFLLVGWAVHDSVLTEERWPRLLKSLRRMLA